MNRHVVLAVKVALTAALLGVLAYKADWHAVGSRLSGASPGWVVLGALLGVPASVFSGLRWRQISAYLGVPLPWRFAVLGAIINLKPRRGRTVSADISRVREQLRRGRI